MTDLRDGGDAAEMTDLRDLGCYAIQCMQACGWKEDEHQEEVVHPELGSFNTWAEALKACIEVASGA